MQEYISEPTTERLRRPLRRLVVDLIERTLLCNACDWTRSLSMPLKMSLLRCCHTFLLTTRLLGVASCPALAQPANRLTLLGVQEEPFPL